MKLRPLTTRAVSSRQEKAVAKVTGGKVNSNSGATAFIKGDIQAGQWLIECKTSMTPKASYSVKQSELQKLNDEKIGMCKDYAALCFDFGQGERYYIITEKTFLEVKNLMEEQR